MRHVVAAFGAFHSLAQTVRGFLMIRAAILGAAAVLLASSATAAPADDAGQKVLAERFQPFDQAAADGWEPATPDPLYLVTSTDKPAGAPLTLQPGAYKIVVLCDCNTMQVTLVGPDSAAVPPERSDGHGAMYSLDVHAAGAYLAGIDMDDCPKAQCAIGVKVYRKKA
jgi:hypothetical protein